MDIAKSFTYMFEDPEYVRKLGIGTLVMLVGILFLPVLIGLLPLIIVMGYCLDVTRNVLDGRSNPLPTWEDWGGFLSRGAKIFFALLIWLLPALLMLVPFGIGAIIADDGRSGGAGFVASLFFICSTCLMILWALVVTVVSPAIYVRLARTGRFASAFDFGAIWAFTRANISNVIVAILLGMVASLITSFVAPLGLIALVIGVLVTLPLAGLWQMLVQAHLYGQVGARDTSVTA